MSSSPRMRQLAEELFPMVAGFLEKNHKKGLEKVKLIDLVHFLQKQGVKKLAFRNTYPYSYQLEYALTNLVCTGRVEERGDLLFLTDYGRKCFSEPHAKTH